MKILLEFTERETKLIKLLGDGDVLILQNKDHVIHMKKKGKEGEVGIKIERHKGFEFDIEPVYGQIESGILLPNDAIELNKIGLKD